MMEFHSMEEVFSFATQSEQDAADFYEWLSSQTPNERLRNVCKQFAREERQHKLKLETLKRMMPNEEMESTPARVKSVNEMVDFSVLAELTYVESLRIAMNAEKATYKLYIELADQTTDASQHDLFLQLAQEEANHKLRFELEYDEQHLTEA